MKRENEQTYCSHCGETINKILFTATMTEEWTWNGMRWECTAHHSLVNSPGQNVTCPECEGIIGTGRDFGF